ncbi:MAG TPA: helix-turn-helix domain-containing protein [Actinocrinis sp.]|jgi:DNA-binding transcriptional MerR regulator
MGDGRTAIGEMNIGEFSRLSRLSLKALRLYGQLGLLEPERIDPDSGYRWYAAEQLERAGLVARLRRIGLPLAEIKALLDRDPAAAAAQVAAFWSAAEAEHAARRSLAVRLIARLKGSDPAMSETVETSEVEVRDLPARQVLSLIRHVHSDELVPAGREFLHRFWDTGAKPLPGVEGAPFTVYHGEVSEDGDGPVEWCWPVAEGQAEEFAARFPDLTLRTDAAHQEAYIRQDPESLSGPARSALLIEILQRWAEREHRTATGAVRLVYRFPPAGERRGPDIDFAVPVRAIAEMS